MFFLAFLPRPRIQGAGAMKNLLTHLLLYVKGGSCITMTALEPGRPVAQRKAFIPLAAAAVRRSVGIGLELGAAAPFGLGQVGVC